MGVFALCYNTVRATSEEKVSEILLQNEVRVDGRVRIETLEAVTVLVDVAPSGVSGVRKDFISQLIRNKLSSAEIKVTKYTGNYQDDLAAKNISSHEP